MSKFEGDLTQGLARPGLKVRCLLLPKVSSRYIWKGSKEIITLPVPGKLYTIRSNILTRTHVGVLLLEIRNPEVAHGAVSGEPFFPHHCFNVVG